MQRTLLSQFWASTHLHKRSLPLIVQALGILFATAVTIDAAASGSDCEPPAEPTFTVFLPKVGLPPDDEGQGWNRPQVWQHHTDATDDSITVPNGRPIYALIVSGYASNKYLDELMVYNFARHLMAQGAYVHYSWWNNLLAPYMERPLHHSQSHPGTLDALELGNFATADDASNKAVPAEDYQFLADAKLFLTAIREHNPRAIIIVVGHSMGGGAVVHLGSQTNELIDILAPIDPVGNRNYPWLPPTAPFQQTYNWTRWRISRDTFVGYRSLEWQGLSTGCVPVGPWLKDFSEISSSALCGGPLAGVYHDAPTLHFGSNIVNLHHRYQKEYLFPFDWEKTFHFGHSPPPNGTTSQVEVPLTHEFCGFPPQRCSDPGGWPAFGGSSECCPDGDGVGWPKDGHGEIVGYRGPLPAPVPLAVRVRTSPQCGDCPNLVWPSRSKTSNGTWLNGNGKARVNLLRKLEGLPLTSNWSHRHTNPSLCLVSQGLINRFNVMNKPPFANAGPDQAIECTGSAGTEVHLDGSASNDPDNDTLTYTWTWPGGIAHVATPTVTFAKGTYCITLQVRDPSGHIDRDYVSVAIQDTTPPNLSVQLSPRLLWPPNHKLQDIVAVVHAEDLCGQVADVSLVSIVSNQAEDAVGSGNTTNDIQSATMNTLDLAFRLRAERAPQLGDRVYTVTYQATDDSGNRAEKSVEIIVPRDATSLHAWQQILN